VTDQLRNLGDYGVSETAQSVHPLGYPMSHSTHVGFNAPVVCETTCDSISCLPRAMRFCTAPFDRLPRSRLSEACGVGQSFRSTACTVSARFNPKPELARRRIVASFVPGPAERLSIALGVGQGFVKSRGERPADRSAIAFVLLASGVGNNPYPVASVRGTNGARRYAMPFRVMPDLGQVPENGSQPSTKQRCHVLQDDVLRSNHANGSNHFPPESRTGSGKSGACTGKGDILAGEASADNVGIGILRGGHVADVRRVGEAQRENARGVGVELRNRDRLEAARALEPKVEAADPCEQREDAQLAHLTPALSFAGSERGERRS
jgi:hypothetical protein